MMMSYMGLLLILVLFCVVVGGVSLVVFFVCRSSGSSQANNPNLAPCPDCGRLISIRATTCPHCGGPVRLK